MRVACLYIERDGGLGVAWSRTADPWWEGLQHGGQGVVLLPTMTDDFSFSDAWPLGSRNTTKFRPSILTVTNFDAVNAKFYIPLHFPP